MTDLLIADNIDLSNASRVKNSLNGVDNQDLVTVAQLNSAVAGGDASYTHTQSSPSATWTINHNLGRYPSIQLLTVGSVEFSADITHISINQSIITIATATAGIAQCN